jgi:transketolase
VPVIYDENYRFQLGKAVTLRPGKQVTVIAIGVMVAAALEAAATLGKSGIDCRVLNMPTLKPMDEAAVIQAAAETGAVVTAEEHLEHGGLGSAVARILAAHQPVPVEFISMKDRYAESGSPAKLMEHYGLTAGDIEQAVQKVLERKAG